MLLLTGAARQLARSGGRLERRAQALHLLIAASPAAALERGPGAPACLYILLEAGGLCCASGRQRGEEEEAERRDEDLCRGCTKRRAAGRLWRGLVATDVVRSLALCLLSSVALYVQTHLTTNQLRRRGEHS